MIFRFQKLKESTTKIQKEKKIAKFITYFDATRLGEGKLRERQTGTSILLQVLCQFENAKEMRQKSTNAAEG